MSRLAPAFYLIKIVNFYTIGTLLKFLDGALKLINSIKTKTPEAVVNHGRQ